MRRATLALLGAILLSETVAQGTTTRRPIVVTSQDHSLVDAEDCAHFHTRTVTSLPSSARSEEKSNVQLVGSRQLIVRTSNEGGVSVRGWNRPYARLTVCKSAVALNDDQAKGTLAGIEVSVKGNEIVAMGPEIDSTQTWWVNMILWVPKNTRIDVTSANGGIAIRNMTGSVKARATNGGISIASCAGDHHLETTNGGISIDKVSGTVNAVTHAGPISLKLRELNIPTLEATTDEQGSIHCSIKDCGSGVAAWAANRKKLRLGGETAPSIRLTSYSADIMIEHVR